MLFDDKLKEKIAGFVVNEIRAYIAKGTARSKVQVFVSEYLVKVSIAYGYRINDQEQIEPSVKFQTDLFRSNGPTKTYMT